MKKLLLAIFAVTSVGFAADRVVTITPNVEASGMLRPNKNNTFVEIPDVAADTSKNIKEKKASSFYVTPTVGLSVEARTKIEKAKLLDKLSVEAGGGLKQDILLVNATDKNIFGSTYAYGLTEVNYAIKHDLKAYAQARLGLGVTYSVVKDNKFFAPFAKDKVEVSAMADLGAGLNYKNVKAGLVLGVKGPIAKEKPASSSDTDPKKLCLPEFTFGVKVGYDIPVRF
ncbi:hypothetical protein [Sneathia sanguinegens]|uniref:hypothetical protein n=1 Tax=Sneathia sanguinegens TaxID=40543 RepID=UPI00288BB114|nr:hypothetical protein [Sneathia sanguinegens]